VLKRFASGFMALLALGGAVSSHSAHADDGDAKDIPGLAQAITTPSGLRYIDRKPGTGKSPSVGDTVSVHYTGWVLDGDHKGVRFDSSFDRNEPLEFPIGMHRVIAGWDEGVGSMKPGGHRTLIIPPELGYGARGAGGVIPPNATLVFDVTLVSVKPVATDGQ
jgi:peptidylprolyl isomerase